MNQQEITDAVRAALAPHADELDEERGPDYVFEEGDIPASILNGLSIPLGRKDEMTYEVTQSYFSHDEAFVDPVVVMHGRPYDLRLVGRGLGEFRGMTYAQLVAEIEKDLALADALAFQLR